MKPWERRLKDLGHVLNNCSATYFEPELFRMNTNHFLTTARTVTFIIQKNKSTIDEFDSWYGENVIRKWADDPVMQWAKNSRNKIEKAGDLDVYSQLDVRLIFSYIEKNDVKINLPGDCLVTYGIKKLIRYARKELPSGASDAAVVKIDRKWVANNLETWELLDAMVYVYARVYECCRDLATHINSTIDNSIPSTIEFDQMQTDSRQVRYVKLNDLHLSSVKSKTIKRGDISSLPEESVKIIEEMRGASRPNDFQENHEFYSYMAKKTYNISGYHVPMLMFFDSKMKVIDFVSTHFDDTASKYIFWRNVADRVAYLKPESLVWISELWLRKADLSLSKPIRSLPITGEMLQICSLNKHGKVLIKNWKIEKDSDDQKGAINGEESEEYEVDSSSPAINFLIPVMSAFKKISGK